MKTQRFANRRDSDRQQLRVPALLHQEMVHTLNLSPGGARLVVRQSQRLSREHPFLLETKNGEMVGLMCETRWEQALGKNYKVVGIRFLDNQPELRVLKRWLAAS